VGSSATATAEQVSQLKELSLFEEEAQLATAAAVLVQPHQSLQQSAAEEVHFPRHKVLLALYTFAQVPQQ